MIYGSRNHLISGPRFAQSSDRRWSRVLHRQAIDTTTRAGRMFFQVTGAFAEFERSMIRSRVKAGLDRAKARGVRLGRPPERKWRRPFAPVWHLPLGHQPVVRHPIPGWGDFRKTCNAKLAVYRGQVGRETRYGRMVI
ncbi:MAG TPA: recombinase family protein [Acetobacteraceae bacterium]|nr:recombinase family protein [Acetobacteraceae bacterium]